MRRARRVLCVILGTVALAGCWPMPGANPDRTSFNDMERTITALTVNDLSEKWRWTSPRGPISDPVTSTGGVHVTSECWVTTLAAGSGAESWSQSISTSDVPCSPAGQTWTSEPYVVGSEVLASVFWSYMGPPGFLESASVATPFDVASGEPGTEASRFIVAQRGTTSASSGVGAHSPAAGAFVFVVGSWGATVWAGPYPGSPITTVTLGTDKLFHSGYGVLDTQPTGDGGTPHFGYGVQAYALGQSPQPGCGPVQWPVPTPGESNVDCPTWATPTDGTPTIPPSSAPTGRRSSCAPARAPCTPSTPPPEPCSGPRPAWGTAANQP